MFFTITHLNGRSNGCRATGAALRRMIASAVSVFGAICAVAAPGDLDTSFGNNGSVGYAVHPVVNGSHSVNAMATQSDGRIILVGSCRVNADRDFCVMRMATNGERDNTFVPGSGSAITAMTAGDDGANAVAIQADDKIVVAGRCGTSFCVARYSPNGALDLSFNGTGKVIVSVQGTDDNGRSVAIQPDGKIVVAGSCEQLQSPLPSKDVFCAIRLLPNGQLDPAFGMLGKLKTEVGSGNSNASSVAIQPDGKIVVAGSCDGASNRDFCVVRYISNGDLDDSSIGNIRFSTDGKLVLPIGTDSDYVNAIAITRDDKIILAGSCINGTETDFCVARINYNGSVDTTFSTNGSTITNVASDVSDASAVAIQPDGKIVLAGTCGAGLSNRDFCLVRYDIDGSFDATFAGNAIPRTDVTQSDSGNAVLVQADGKIVVGGSCMYTSGNSTFNVYCAARYVSGPFTYQACSPDIDGDGRTTATVDALIMTRVMLGMTGNAVLGGINFPPTATRTTWGGGGSSDIRRYLVTHCGMRIAP